jgi:hypothetical protein
VRPPRLEVFAFRAFGWRLDGRYAGWITEDVRSGRALRWRWLTCGVAVVGTQLLVRAAFARRGAPGAMPLLATIGGGVLGLVLGTVLVRRMGTDRHVRRVLRSQGLLEDGRRDPAPSWTGRLDNYGVASIQMATLAFLGLMAGWLPVQAIPVPRGRCVEPDAAIVARLRAELRPGLRIRGLRAVERKPVTFVAGVVDGRGVVTWQRIAGADGPLLGARADTGVVTPGLGVGVAFGTGDRTWEAPREKVERCAAEAAREGKGPTITVAPPPAEVEAGVVRLRGPVDLELRGVAASCSPESGIGSAALSLPAGDSTGFLLVRGPSVTATVVTPGPTGRAYVGRLGAVAGDELLVDGVLGPTGGQPGPPRHVTARLPCR